VNDIVIVRSGPDQGLYLNGVKVPGALKVEPAHFGPGELPTAKLVLHIRSYSFADKAPSKQE
jgi:hypothetical protein